MNYSKGRLTHPADGVRLHLRGDFVGVQPNPVAAVGFDPVERFVGALDQFVDAGGVRGVGRDPDRHRQAEHFAVRERDRLVGHGVVQPVGQGETFRGSEFLGGSGAAISQQLKQGEVLFAFPIVDLLSQSNLIQDGDHVDLLLTIQQKGPNGEDLGKATAITLQNIEIFKVLRPQATEDEQQPRATALLLSMKPEDAVMIKFVKDSGGTIDFTLRSP